jgi:hypothetical protein
MSAVYHLSAAQLLEMPECLLLRYAEEMPRIRALWVLDASEAAAFPHMGKAARAWRREWTQRARGALRRAQALFVVNGQPVTGAGLKAWAGRMLGRGFESD